MSTFGGSFEEIPFISVDRFDEANLQSECFFLSHCHTDHMIGLEHPNGLPKVLYTSEISAVIIRQKYPEKHIIKTLEIGIPSIIDDLSKKLIVTAIPAGHCPGSVMFIFETTNHRILYTGDFRVILKDLTNLQSFKSLSGVLNFDALYFDSTFFYQHYFHFPSQVESAEEICKLIQEWISKGSSYLVSLKTPARYGYEYLFIEIARIMKMRIHVDNSEFKKYCYIPEMDNCVTNDGSSTQIHACFDYLSNNHKNLKCRKIDDSNYLRVIRPSAMIWKNWDKTKNIVHSLNDEIYRVCYSNHASYKEIVDMILYLKPKKIVMNVLPSTDSEKLSMQNCILKLMSEYNSSGLSNTLDSFKSNLTFNFENIKSNIRADSLKHFKCTSDDEDEVTSQITLPLKRFKQ